MPRAVPWSRRHAHGVTWEERCWAVRREVGDRSTLVATHRCRDILGGVIDTCALCAPPGEQLDRLSIDRLSIDMHRECQLRAALGGIGHIVAHPYWCGERKDPDGGLTYRQSALLVDAWVHVMGVESTVQREHDGWVDE